MSSQVISMLVDRQSEIRLLVDSGAFTAWKAGKTIKVDDYCNFLEKLPVTPFKYFALDVVGNPKETLKNYETMLARGFKPIPIFTRGEDPSVLEDYYKTSDIVGVGGLVGTLRNKGFVKGIMKIVGKRKVHLLGFTSLPFLKLFKPYMVDSSSWESSGRYGNAPLYLGRGLPIVMLTKDTVTPMLRDIRVLHAIEKCNLKPNDFLTKSHWNGGKSITRRLAARSMRFFSEDVFTNLGVNMFLAAAGPLAVELLLEEN